SCIETSQSPMLRSAARPSTLGTTLAWSRHRWCRRASCASLGRVSRGTRMAGESDRVVETFLRYSSAFERLESRAILPFYLEPSLLISPQGVVSLPTHADAASFFDKLMMGLRARGYARSEFGRLQAVLLADDLAVLTNVGEWRTASGTVL